MATGTPKHVLEADRLATELFEKHRQEQDAQKAGLEKQEQAQEQLGTQQETPAIPNTDEAQAQAEQPQAQENSAPADDRENSVEYWRQKYLVLQGKYNAELKNRPEPSDNGSEVKRLYSVIDNLKSDLEYERKLRTEKPKDFDPKEYLDKEDIDEFGEDYWKKQGKLVTRIAEKMTRENERRIEQWQKKNFVDSIVASIPNFSAQNSDPEFIGWLNATQDGFSGRNLQETLQNAFDSGNADVVRKIFSSYKPQDGQGQQAQGRTQIPQNMVAPKKTPAVPAPQANKRVFTLSETRRITKDIATGMYKNNPERAKELQKEIELAFLENRVKEG